VLSRHDSGGRERVYLRDPAFLERARTRFEGRTRRAHVIDQHHGFPDEPPGGPRQPKGAAHARGDDRAGLTAPTLRGCAEEPGTLGWSRREIYGLVEPAPATVERYATARPGEKIPASIVHHAASGPASDRRPSYFSATMDRSAPSHAPIARSIDVLRVRRHQSATGCGRIVRHVGDRATM
jgi:hypothetical protein